MTEAATIHLIAIGSALMACCLSAWMWNHSAGWKGLPGCGKGSPCDTVTKGRWSRWGSIPVIALGTASYTALAAALIAVVASAQTQPFASEIASTDSLIILASSTWFIVLQIFVIRRLCYYCMLIHALGLTAAILALVSGWQTTPPELLLITSIAAASVLILITGQLLLTPKTFAVIDAPNAIPERIEAHVSGRNFAAITGPPAPKPLKITNLVERHIPLFRERIIVDTAVFPVIGPPSAPFVLGYLFDYTCHECHHMHRLLYEAIDEYAGKLAIALIPVPLHYSCNPTVNCPKQERVQACWYARLMFALWMTNPDRFCEWDRFMAAGPKHPAFGFASAKAKELADLNSFRFSDADDRMDPRIAGGIKLYEVASKPAIPSLILPGGILRGHIPDKATLFDLLNRLLAIDRKTNSQGATPN